MLLSPFITARTFIIPGAQKYQIFFKKSRKCKSENRIDLREKMINGNLQESSHSLSYPLDDNESALVLNSLKMYGSLKKHCISDVELVPWEGQYGNCWHKSKLLIAYLSSAVTLRDILFYQIKLVKQNALLNAVNENQLEFAISHMGQE